jgi:hypothetical protein
MHALNRAHAIWPVFLKRQMISLALAARSGSEAGRFRLATKVTSID